MQRSVSMGLVWGVAGYFLTIILIPVMGGEQMSSYKLIMGIFLWAITGVAIANVFYGKAKPATKAKKKKKR